MIDRRIEEKRMNAKTTSPQEYYTNWLFGMRRFGSVAFTTTYTKMTMDADDSIIPVRWFGCVYVNLESLNIQSRGRNRQENAKTVGRGAG